ncbi:MAG: ribonuclease HII [Ruminococcaceae bacterium]|nr:ribonuclease HII [Oscillospiraceae bacterium]
MITMEQELHNQGLRYIAGVDEAGRGPLAGPVFAAAVIMEEDKYIPDIKDSKKLSEKKREEVYEYIIHNAVSYAICSVDEGVIDEINILNATFRAMLGAVEGLDVMPDYVLVDGNRSKGLTLPHECVVKGDAKVACIAAASILAKVSRDRFICECDGKYPGYGFAKHKGYGTKVHIEAIKELGLCPIHRKTFCTKFTE